MEERRVENRSEREGGGSAEAKASRARIPERSCEKRGDEQGDQEAKTRRMMIDEDSVRASKRGNEEKEDKDYWKEFAEEAKAKLRMKAEGVGVVMVGELETNDDEGAAK